MTIPHLPSRLNSMIFRRTLDQELDGIRPELAILRNATTELRRSVRLRTILRVSLFYSYKKAVSRYQTVHPYVG
jgi:hypothetical protein